MLFVCLLRDVGMLLVFKTVTTVMPEDGGRINVLLTRVDSK